MNFEELIEYLECAWDREGFLGGIREGKFVAGDGEKFLSMLGAIQINEEALVPKRLVSLLWYLPSFLEWQNKRVQEKSGNLELYRHFVTSIHNTLENVLGVP